MYNSQGYVFEIEIIVEYLMISAAVFLLIWILNKFIKSKIKDFIISLILIAWIALIPMTFVAPYVLKDIPWKIEKVGKVNIDEIKLIKMYDGSQRQEKYYYQYLSENGYLNRILANSTKLDTDLDQATQIIFYYKSRSWLLWWQEDDMYIVAD